MFETVLDIDKTVIIIHRYELVYALEFGTMSFDLTFELNILKFVCALCHFGVFVTDMMYFLALSSKAIKGLLLFIPKTT